MKKSSSISLKYGLLLSAALIGYFLILSLFGLHIYVWYSLFNGILTGLGIFLAIKAYRRGKTKYKYQKGFMVGLMTGFYATILFAIFFALYASYVYPDFTSDLINEWDMMSFDMGLGQIIFVVVTMGFVTTFILTLACMQYLKESWNPHQSHEKTKETANPNFYKPERKA